MIRPIAHGRAAESLKNETLGHLLSLTQQKWHNIARRLANRPYAVGCPPRRSSTLSAMLRC